MQRCSPAIFFLLLTVSCNPLSPASSTTISTVPENTNISQAPTIFATATGTQTVTEPSLHPSETPVSNPEFSTPAQYNLTGKLDYISHNLVVDEVISYHNATGETLPELVLAVESNLWVGCFQLGNLTIDGHAVTNTTLLGNRLDVPLSVPLIPGGSLSVSIQYTLNLPAADSHHVFGFNNLQINLVDWYPFIVPFTGGWLIHPPANVGENLVYDTADYDVQFSVVDPTLPIILAASSSPVSTGDTWHYTLHSAHTFALSASPNYQSAAINTGKIDTTSYFFREDKTPGLVVLSEVSKALSTFGNLFGPIQYKSLSIVESPFYDGLEYDGLFFLSRDFYKRDDGTVLNDLVDIAVHETAHLWWFGSVGNDQALEPWLDEAMATYSEQLFYEKNYPLISAWWSFRVDAYDPSGWVDTDIYHGKDFRSYANAVYLQGARFLGALRKLIGDEAFFAFIKDYSSQMAGRRATADDFFRILRLHSTLDLSGIQQTYFQRLH